MKRWVLLLATLWPLIYMAVFVTLFVRAWTTGDDDALFSPALITAHVLAFGTIVALLVIYIRDLLRRDLPQESQAIWGVLMATLGPLVMLAYWWRYVLR